MKILAVISLISLSLAAFLPAQALPRRQEDPIPGAVESIYRRGLRHLANTQTEDGSWSDNVGSEPGVVGLALMAFLAHGEDPRFGPYSSHIEKAINYLLTQQKKKKNGYMGSSMYSHGFATLALAECYGLFPDKRLGEPLQKAVDLILTAQKRNPKGGWRYQPDDTSADTSVVGCQIVALYAARNAGIPVPEEALTKARKYMIRCRSNSGGYGYTNAGEKITLTAIGVLCESLAKKHDEKSYQVSANLLVEKIDYRDPHYAYYFDYYMAQALFHSNEEAWREWNSKQTRYLSAIQASDGSFPSNFGTTFGTAGGLLSLALNYRFLPIYEK